MPDKLQAKCCPLINRFHELPSEHRVFREEADGVFPLLHPFHKALKSLFGRVSRQLSLQARHVELQGHCEVEHLEQSPWQGLVKRLLD